MKKTQNIKQYRKAYYEKNKEKIKENFKRYCSNGYDPYEKVLCIECDKKISRCSLSKHNKTKTHLNRKRKNDYKILLFENIIDN
jgi:hypothetical protein